MEYEIIYNEDTPLELNDYKIVYHNKLELVDLAGGGIKDQRLKEKRNMQDY